MKSQTHTLLGLTALMLALLSLAGTVRAQSNVVDVCPTARWKALPFLRIPAKGASLADVVRGVINAGSINRQALAAAGVQYLKTSLVPRVGFNAFLIAASLVTLVFFVVWRVLRWCCVVCCCRDSCDARRAGHDPFRILFGARARVLKATMLLFALAAVALEIVGMAGTQRAVVADALGTFDTLSGFLEGALVHLDDLSQSVGNVSAAITGLQGVVTGDVDVAGFRTRAATAGAFLASAPAPAGLAASLASLETAVHVALPAALAALGTSVAATGAGSTMGLALAATGSAMSSAAAMANTLTTLSASIIALPAGGGGNAYAGNAQVDAFITALDAASLGMAPGGWPATLDALTAAIDLLDGLQGPTNNPLTVASTALATVSAQATTLSATSIPSLAASLTAVDAGYAAARPSLVWLAARLAAVNDTVLALTPDMEAARAGVAGAVTALDAFFGSTPTPAALATSLTGAAAGIAMPAASGAVAGQLAAQAAVLDSAQFDATPGGSDGAALKTWVTQTKAAIAAAQSNFDAMVAAKNTYNGAGGQTDTNYDAMKTAADTYAAGATPSLQNKAGEQAAAPCAAANFVSPSASVGAAGAAAAATFGPFAVSATAAAAGVPALGGYASSIGSVALPASTVFAGPQSALDAIEAAVITQGDVVKASVSGASGAVSGASGAVRASALDRLTALSAAAAPRAAEVDRYRYAAAMALYALPIAAMLALLLSALALNFQFGTTVAVLWLSVLLVLGFLLAGVGALLLAVLKDACPAVEPLIVSVAQTAAPALAPVAAYYFNASSSAGSGATGAAGLKSALLAAGLVDVDQILGQAAAARGGAVANMTATYTFRAGPAALLGRVNSSVDGAVAAVDALLGAASREAVLPVYGAAKGLLCCAVPDAFTSLWLALSIGGLLAWFLCLLAFGYLGRLDGLPRVDCCGCTCHTYSRYRGTAAAPPHGPARHHAHAAGAVPAGAPPRGPPGPMAVQRGGGDVEAGGSGGAWDEGTVVAELVVRPAGGGGGGKGGKHHHH